MGDNVVIVPAEDRVIAVRGESRTIEVPGEHRIIEVHRGAVMFSKQHTAGDTRRWKLNYDAWLENTATIVPAPSITSSSTTLLVDPAAVTVLGREVVFMVNGGEVGETATLTIVIEDSFGNVKTDTLAMTCVAP